MEQLLSTPVRPAELVLGKLLAYFALGLVDMLICVLVGVFVFQVPLRGSVWFLFFTQLRVPVRRAVLGHLHLGRGAHRSCMAYQLGMLSSFLPAFLLSGFIYSIENMPQVIQVISYIVPARYFVTIVNGVFLKGVGFEMLWGRSCCSWLLYAALVFCAARRAK